MPPPRFERGTPGLGMGCGASGLHQSATTSRARRSKRRPQIAAGCNALLAQRGRNGANDLATSRDLLPSLSLAHSVAWRRRMSPSCALGRRSEHHDPCRLTCQAVGFSAIIARSSAGVPRPTMRTRRGVGPCERAMLPRKAMAPACEPALRGALADGCCASRRSRLESSDGNGKATLFRLR
jgi:hypothetical protein